MNHSPDRHSPLDLRPWLIPALVLAGAAFFAGAERTISPDDLALFESKIRHVFWFPLCLCFAWRKDHLTPYARPRSDRLRCGGRESKFLKYYCDPMLERIR
jgi:hypothetical protein